MSALQRLQAQFQRFILKDEEEFPAQVIEDARGSRERRLAVYRDGYRLRLLEALRTNYPALHELLGDDQFNLVGLDYIETRPSTFRNLRWFGGDLGEFLLHHPSAGQHPVLGELAQFEWALSLAFDAADAPTLRFEDLVALPAEAWPVLCLYLHPSVQVRLQATNAALIRRARDLGEAAPEPAAAEGYTHWLIWRMDEVCHFRSLGRDEAAGLDVVAAGGDFTALCTCLGQFHAEEEVPARAAGMLRGWVDAGMITGTSSG